jgi:hypothetical protein
MVVNIVTTMHKRVNVTEFFMFFSVALDENPRFFPQAFLANPFGYLTTPVDTER